MARYGEVWLGLVRCGKEMAAFGSPFFLLGESVKTDELLSVFEGCNRAGVWARDWERHGLRASEFLQMGVREGLTTNRTDFGEAAGETVVGLGRDRDLITKAPDVYSQIIHLAALSDVISSTIRKPQDGPWRVAEPVRLGEGPTWDSGALLAPSGQYLRRVVFASSWNDDKHYYFCRSWGTLGAVCAYQLPMQMAVVILGSHRDGKYHSYWTKGLRHPANKKLRFRKRNDVATGFKSSWLQVWREDFDDISTQEWIAGMLEDNILKDVCFSVEVPVPERSARERIVNLAVRKLDKIENVKVLPDQQLATCDLPFPCQFRNNCHSGNEPSGRYGFVRIDL